MRGEELPMRLDLERVRENAAGATTEDLLDRVTAYRSGMEPAALEVSEAELFRRGVGPREIEAYDLARQTTPRDANGLAAKCLHCARPAVWRGWTMYRFWGLLPLFPWRVALCAEHLHER